jgi:hypothetical protein
MNTKLVVRRYLKESYIQKRKRNPTRKILGKEKTRKGKNKFH